jgi:putative FmdB family regulatory protein
MLVPTYEYECDKCRRVFEIRQRITEPALTTCDACGGAVRRLLSPAPFILKGDGWYVTDYPSESRKKAVQAEKTSTSSPTGGDKGAAGKSESKSETPTPSTSTTAGSPSTSASKTSD